MEAGKTLGEVNYDTTKFLVCMVRPHPKRCHAGVGQTAHK